MQLRREAIQINRLTLPSKRKSFKTGFEQSAPEVLEKIGVPHLGKSNEVLQEQSVLGTTEPILGEELPVIREDGLEIMDESGLDIEQKAPDSQQKLSYFGYDIFARDPALFQATSAGAVDPNYLIGPGDEIIVMLWGDPIPPSANSRSGRVCIHSEIGQVFVNGLNLNLLESKLFRVFSQSYASLNLRVEHPLHSWM